jgi:glycosyltransferase involved in cell wall biosynthesis
MKNLVPIQADRRIKVLFVTAWYPTRDQPVAGIFVREHAKAVQLHNDVFVLHLVGPDPKLKGLWRLEQETDQTVTEGIPTYRLWHWLSPILKTSYFLQLWSTFRAFRHFVNQRFSPDLIHAHIYSAGLPAVLIGRLHNVPVIVSEHFTGFPRRLLNRKEVWKAKWAFRLAKNVLVVSHGLQKAIEAYDIRARFQVIPNVVDISLFYPPSNKFLNSNRKVLLFVGLLDPSHKKGVPYLLRALGKLGEKRKDWHLNILGDGEVRTEYERMAWELGIAEKVTFHGLKSKQEVAKFMRQADLFVLPSLYETFSVVAAEALAAGVPVLTTRCGGPEEFVSDEVGMVIPPSDMEALLKALDWMLDHLERFPPERLANYAADRFAAKHVGFLIHQAYLETLIGHAATI